MDFYDLLQRDLPFALSVQYNLLYAYSYPDCDTASQALGNLIVNLSLLRSAKAQIIKEFDQIKMESYLKTAILQQCQRLNKPSNQQLSKVDAFDYDNFMNERKKLYQKLADQKYNHVIKTMQSLFQILQNFNDDEVHEVFNTVKEQLERTRIDGDVLTHLKRHTKSPLEAAGKSSTLPGIRIDFARYVPPLKPIEYQQDEKLEAENEESFLELHRVKSSGRIDPFQVGSVKSDHRPALNIQTNQDDGAKSFFLQSPKNPNLSPKQRISKNLEILRKSQVINSEIQRKEAKYHGLNIEIILDIMNFSMKTSQTILKKLGQKRLLVEDLTKIKDNRTQIDLKMQRYYKRLQPKIKELIYKVWGLIDHQTNIQKFIFRPDQNKEDEEQEQEQQEQEQQQQEVKKDKSQQSKEKEEEAPFHQNNTSFKKVGDQEQILEQAKPQQNNNNDSVHSHHESNDDKEQSQDNNQTKPLIQISELDIVEAQDHSQENQPDNQEENNRVDEQNQEKSQKDEVVTPRLKVSNDHIWDELQKSHRSYNSPENLLYPQNKQLQIQELQVSKHLSDRENQKIEDAFEEDSDYDPKEARIIIQQDAFDTLQQVKHKDDSFEFPPSPQEPANQQQQFEQPPPPQEPASQQQQFEQPPPSLEPANMEEEVMIQKDAFDDDYPDEIKPIGKKQDSIKEEESPQYDAFDYPDQIKPVKSEKSQHSFRDQIGAYKQNDIVDAFQVQDAFDEPQSEVIFQAPQNNLEGVIVDHPADAFDELQFKSKDESDQEGNAFNDDDEQVKSQVVSVSKNAFDGFRASMIQEPRVLTTEGDDNYSEIADERPQGLMFPPALEARIISWKIEILNKTWAC